MIEALGTIARSGTKAFLERLEAGQKQSEGEGNALIGRFGVGFYSAFMVAERVDVISRRAGAEAAWQWSSDGKGAFDIFPVIDGQAARRGARVVLHLMDDAKQYAERATVEPLIKAQSGHVPVPIAIVDKPGAAPAEITDGAALWIKPKSRNQCGGLHRLLPQHRDGFRRAGADHPFSRRGPAGLYGASFRSRFAAVRSVRPRSRGPHQALRQASLHCRRCRDPAALSALRARPRRFRRSAAQRLARENPGEPAARRDQKRRDQPRPCRA